MKKESEIRYGIFPSPFGKYFLALTSREVCALHFLGSGGEKVAVLQLKKDWPGVPVIRDDRRTTPYAKKLFTPAGKQVSIPLVLCGTDFQLRVWDALLAIPEGEVVTYGDIAKRIKAPRAVRAVGTACGQNSIAYLVPCHRVLPSTGGLGSYRWGIGRKKALLAWEASRA